MSKDYKPSINSKFDIGKDSLLTNYIPTESHVTTFESILRAIVQKGRHHSHLIIGPYGTGKSYLTTLLSGIVSSEYTKDQLTPFILRLKAISETESIADLVQKIMESERKYIPVLINGKEGTLEEAIINNLYKIAAEYLPGYPLPGISSTILEILERWKMEYPAAYSSFSRAVIEKGYTVTQFTNEIKDYNLGCIRLFQSIYKDLTFGSNLTITKSQTDLLDITEALLSELREKNFGLIIVYDEFGRYLQSLQSDEINKSMQDLQDLAELANNGVDNLELVLVSHKKLDSYFVSLNQNVQQEFKRIEGRFQTYTIQPDQSVTATIIKERLSDINPNLKIPESLKEYYIQQMRIYDLFDLPSVSLENLVISGSYPFHPVSLYLLSALSNTFGQNERTLFTYLESNEPGGYQSFIKTEQAILYPDYLYPYFFINESSLGSESRLYTIVKKNLDILQNLETDLDKNKLLRLMRFISLWELADLHEKQKLDLAFLSFSTGISDQINQYLNFLVQNKLIRYNYRLDTYEIIQGSSTDLEETIRNYPVSNSLSRNGFTEYLSSFLKKRFEKATLYNNEKKMVRFANFSFCIPKSLDEIGSINHPDSDMSIILYILNESDLDKALVVEKLNYINKEDLVFCIPNLNFRVLYGQYKRFTTLRKLSQDRNLMEKDPLIINEIEYQLDLCRFVTEKEMLPLTEFSKNNIWIHDGRQTSVNNEYELQILLSEISFSMYPKTPIIVNDLLNRRNITGIQKKAAINVIESLLSDTDITGHGPDYLAYYSVLTANGYDSTSSYNNYGKLDSLYHDLMLTLQEKNQLTDITDVFTSSNFGYGIRKPLIPVIFTALLKSVWNNILFYNNDAFLMGLTAANIYEMFNYPQGITFIYHHYTEEQEQVISDILYLFGSREEDASKPNHLKAGWAIYSWLKSLQKYAQISFEIPEDLIRFRDAINYFSIDPIGSLDRLSTWDVNELGRMRIALESVVVDKENQIMKWLCSLFGVDTFNKLHQKAASEDIEYQKANPLIKTLADANQLSPIEALSEEILGTSIGDWSDSADDVFQREVLKYFEQWQHKSLSNNEIISLTIDGEKKAIYRINDLSHQGKNLYSHLQAMINAQNRRVSSDEISFILCKLLKEELGEND